MAKKTKEQIKEQRKGIFKEFVAFINKGNALALAIGVILGGAFTSIVNAINTNIISPIIAWIIGDTDLSESLITVLKSHEEVRVATDTDVANNLASNIGDQFTVTVNDIVISWGALIQAIIDFILIAIILFAIIKICTAIAKKAKETAEKFHKKEQVEEVKEEKEPEAVPEDIQLLSEIRDLLKEQSGNNYQTKNNSKNKNKHKK